MNTIKKNRDTISVPLNPAVDFDLNQILNSFCKKINLPNNVKRTISTTLYLDGILLSLVGSNEAELNDSSSLAERHNIHCLLIGDPGIGKSELLRYTSLLCQKSIYVCASNSTNAGLSASVHQERNSNGSMFAIDAGALAMPDKGLVLLDELDKCENRKSLLDALEQQKIFLAKGKGNSYAPCMHDAQSSLPQTP